MNQCPSSHLSVSERKMLGATVINKKGQDNQLKSLVVGYSAKRCQKNQSDTPGAEKKTYSRKSWFWDTQVAQLVEHKTPDVRVINLRSSLGIEIKKS